MNEQMMGSGTDRPKKTASPHETGIPAEYTDEYPADVFFRAYIFHWPSGDALDSSPGYPDKIVHRFSMSIQVTGGIIPGVRHDHFLPNPFQLDSKGF
jgi:hypothetical protein